MMRRYEDSLVGYDEEIQRYHSAGNASSTGGGGLAIIERARPADGNLVPAGLPCPHCRDERMGRMIPDNGDLWCVACGYRE